MSFVSPHRFTTRGPPPQRVAREHAYYAQQQQQDLRRFAQKSAQHVLSRHPHRQWRQRDARNMPLLQPFVVHAYDPVYHHYWQTSASHPSSTQTLLTQHYANDWVYPY